MTINTIEALKNFLASGEFHHATMRTDMARGLHIYGKEDNKFNGFKPVGYFSRMADEKLCDEAYDVVKKYGVYEGSYK